MLAYLTFSDIAPTPLDATSSAEIQALAAESMGWQPLGPRAYLHQGDAEGDEGVIYVVGVPDAGMAGMNVLLLA